MRFARQLAGKTRVALRSLILVIAAAIGGFIVFEISPARGGAWLFHWFSIQAILFVVVYAARSPWWKTQIGRALMYQTGSLALIGAQGMVAMNWPTLQFRLEARMVIFLIVVLTSLNMLMMIVKIQGETRAAARRAQYEKNWEEYARLSQEVEE